MTDKQIYSTKVCVWCGIGIVVCLLLAYLIPSSPSSEARVDVDSGFFENSERRGSLSPPPPPPLPLRSFDDSIPTIEEVQRFLSDKGYYKGKIDGKLAPNWQDSQTQAAWDAYLCDFYARQFITYESLRSEEREFE